MKLIKKMRKGFTLIELVVVIAVIAILSAVSVVSYIAITNKAKQSADEQAVRQMNTVLAANEILSGKSIYEAVDALSENGLSAKDYTPLAKGKFFFWDQKDNRIIYAEYKNGDYVCIFPESYSGKTYSSLGHQWFSLNTNVQTEKVEFESQSGGNTFEATSGKQVAGLFDTLSSAINKETVSNNATTPKTIDGVSLKPVGLSDGNFYGLSGALEINLTSNIDLMGSPFNLNLVDCDFVLNGNGYTISGISNMSGFAVSSANSEGTASEYGGAFIGYTKNANVTFNNVKFKNCSFGADAVKGSSVLVGQATDSNVTIKDVTIEDCSVFGKKGVSACVGHFIRSIPAGEAESSFTVQYSGSNTIKNVEIKALESTIGTLVGRFTKNGANGSMSVLGTSTIVAENITQYINGAKQSTNKWIVGASDPNAKADCVK